MEKSRITFLFHHNTIRCKQINSTNHRTKESKHNYQFHCHQSDFEWKLDYETKIAIPALDCTGGIAATRWGRRYIRYIEMTQGIEVAEKNVRRKPGKVSGRATRTNKRHIPQDFGRNRPKWERSFAGQRQHHCEWYKVTTFSGILHTGT